MAVVYHWKHGWIPLTHEAALSKSKGNHALAARMLNDAHSGSAGFHSRQDVAKGVRDLPNVASGDLSSAHGQLADAAHTHSSGDLLPPGVSKDAHDRYMAHKTGAIDTSVSGLAHAHAEAKAADLRAQHRAFERGDYANAPDIPRTALPRADEFPNTSTRSLLAMNAQYLREYRANPTAANLRAVERSSRELSRRGA